MRQGEVYWYDFGGKVGKRPCVIIQNNAINDTAINSIIVCMITSNLRQASIASNVYLKTGEGGLPKESVVNTSQIFTIRKGDLNDFLGILPQDKIRLIINGVRSLIEI